MLINLFKIHRVKNWSYFWKFKFNFKIISFKNRQIKTEMIEKRKTWKDKKKPRRKYGNQEKEMKINKVKH